MPADHPYQYVIFFENVYTATASAEDIVITDKLDPDLGWNTLSLGETSHPTTTTEFDSATGVITWTFIGINLPPNVSPPEGEGWVTFEIEPEESLSSGTQIRNKATIVFDVNPPMDTNEVINTIDALPPSSSVSALPQGQTDPNFEVSWSGDDDAQGSGVRDYTIYVSDNGLDYTPWLVFTTTLSATFTGVPGHSYGFYSVARDNVGNVEDSPVEPDATTFIWSSIYLPIIMRSY